MNDNFHEQLITKKQKGNPLVIRIIVVVFIILFLTIGALFLGFLSIIIAVVLGVTAYFYIFPNLSVEYEYSLVNHELDITAIYSKSKRKELCSFDIKEAEMIAPKGSSKLASFKPVKTCDYTSGEGNAAIYSIIIFLNQQMYYGKAMMAIFLFVIHVETLTIISLLIYLMVMKVRQSNIFVCNLVGCTILKD